MFMVSEEKQRTGVPVIEVVINYELRVFRLAKHFRYFVCKYISDAMYPHTLRLFALGVTVELNIFNSAMVLDNMVFHNQHGISWL